MWNAECETRNWGWFLRCKKTHKIFRLLIRQTTFDTFSHRRRLADVKLSTIVLSKAYFQYTHRSSAQIKRRLPPRGGSRRRRVEEYACIINFNIFMPKNSFRHCFAMPHVRAAPSVCFADVSPSYGERPLKGRLWKLFFSRDSSSVKLRLTPSPTGEGSQMLSFWQQFGIKHTFSLLLREKGDRVSGGWVVPWEKQFSEPPFLREVALRSNDGRSF